MAMIKDPGELRKEVVIKKLSVVDGDSGVTAETWTTQDTVFGKVVPIRGREYWIGNQLEADVTVAIVIRYFAGLAPTGYRLEIGSRILNIVQVINDEERDVYMGVLCKEAVGAAV